MGEKGGGDLLFLEELRTVSVSRVKYISVSVKW